MSNDPFLTDFANPPATHRSMPLWVWNGEMAEMRITEMLEQFKAQGMGGVFVHPRPGLITEYLSDRWFELWGFALRECKRLGLICNVYDENSYPSAFAGGHVPSRIPFAITQYVEPVTYTRDTFTPQGEIIAAYQLDASGQPAARIQGRPAFEAAIAAGPVLALELRRATGSPWTAWFPFVDQTRPEVAREFIATTYQPYFDHFGKDFGATVRAFFCDEPLLATAGAYVFSRGLPMSRFILREFKCDHGYDLTDCMADLFLDSPGAHATRFDYYWTLQRLWTHNFLKPLGEWCEARGVWFTGHFMEHEWPYPYLSPDAMDGYRYLAMPGIDLLAPQFDFQAPTRSSLYTLTIRELSSAANQLGKPRAMCETHGVGGYEATLEEFKRVSDWLMVNGVNFINQHLSFETISGARKYDHPQTFSDHAPWWDSYRPHADHVARLSVALTQGQPRNRVLVLHPTTSGWIYASPMRKTGILGMRPDSDSKAAIDHDPAAELRASQSELVQWLCDHHVDFDLGDELLMRDLATVVASVETASAKTELKIGQGRYEAVVLPRGMDNWCETTLKLIERYLAQGGKLIALGAAPTFINGRPDERPAKLASSPSWVRVDSLEDLQQQLDRLAPPLITTTDGKHLPTLIGHQVRHLDDGHGQVLHFLANYSPDAVKLDVRLAGATLHQLDTFTGAQTELAVQRDGDHFITTLDLPSAGHVLWLVSNEAARATSATPATKPETVMIEISNWEKIERTSPNTLALDFCDLTVNTTGDGAITQRGLYVTRANRLCWQSHGFDHDVWDRAIQFRRNYLDFKFDANSGFRVDYHFELDARCIGTPAAELSLALEHPELYRVEINGQVVSFDGASRWLDETMHIAPIRKCVRAGSNTVTLIAQPFNILCEIDRIYLAGDFAIEPSTPGFRIVPPTPLMTGDWTKQGLTMYAGGVRYETHVTLDQPARGYEIHAPQWAGALMKVKLNGDAVGQISFPPYRLRVESELKAGSHEIELEVIGTLKNLLGPHFCKQPRRNRWTGPGAWDDWPEQPANGEHYEILPYGLLGTVHISADRES